MAEVEEPTKSLILGKLDELDSFYRSNLLSGDSTKFLTAELEINNIDFIKACVCSGWFKPNELSNWLSNLNHYNGKPCA